MIVNKIIEPRYRVEMTAKQKENLTMVLSTIEAAINSGALQVMSIDEIEVLRDLRVSLLNAS